MKIQLLVTTGSKLYDLSEIASGITWSTSILSQPGKLEFEMLDDASVFLRAGDVIELKVDGRKVFKGKVFGRGKQKGRMWKHTAYDATRYLQNEDTLVFSASTASSRFKTICQTQGLPHKILDSSSYNCAAVVEDKHSYYSMLEEALESTRKHQKTRFGFWDNYGTLEFFNLNRMITKLVIGDNSLLLDYDFNASIDEAANSVKVLREDREKGKREVFVARHDGNIAKWGKLQIVETISDAELNSSQLQNQANVLLREHNKEVKDLTIEALGHMSLRAGNSFILRIKDLQREGIGRDNLALITKCTHYLGSAHTMQLDVEVVA